MPPICLSILTAVYNEANSIKIVLERVATAIQSMTAEVIVVDNGSRDNSSTVIKEFARAHPEVSLKLIRLEQNAGKGAAIRKALESAQGDLCIIQDADFEYDPVDYPRLLKPLLDGEADVVLGSRFLFDEQRRPLGFWQAIVNHLISAATGLATGLALSDVETGYKAFRTSLAKSIPLHSNTFGLDPEIVVQFAKRRARFMEVPIHYRGRTPEQGKKIRASDTFDALWTIFRTRLFSSPYKDAGPNILAIMSRAKRFNRWMADTIQPFVLGEVLELGAGIGNLTMLLANGRHRYLATDTDQESLNELRARLEYRPNVQSCHLDFSCEEEVKNFQQSADTVVCLNVLEHVEDDRAALVNIKHCLRPRGTAIVLVPQGPELFGSIDQVLEHKRRYTKDELVEKMTSAGFRVEQVIDFNRATRPGWYWNSRVLRRKTISSVQLGIFDWLVPVLRRVDENFPWPANSLIAIGVADE